MATPAVIRLDPNTPITLSPIKDEAYGSGLQADPSDGRRSRRQAVEMKNYQGMRSKYQEAKIRMERMKQEGENNKRMLIEMSGVITALKDISIEYDRDDKAVASPILNVQRKIRAIDDQLKSAMMQNGHLEQEKHLQSTTIRAQEGRIKSMEDQITILQKSLKKAVADKKKVILSEKEELKEMKVKGELQITIKAQENKITVLEDQVRRFSVDRNSVVSRQIEALNGSHEAKFLEIDAMQKKLQALRSAQAGAQAGHSTDIVLFEGKAVPTKHVSFDPSTSAPTLGQTIERTPSSDHSTNSSGSSTSRSSSIGGRNSLTSISEEDSEDEDKIFADDRARIFFSRSSSNDESDKEKEDPSIRIASSCDESVEIMVGKRSRFDVSDVSYSTDASTRSPIHDFEAEYNQAMTKVQLLQTENEKLRKNHSQALSNMAQVSNVTASAEQLKKEHGEMKRALEVEKQSATLANTKYEKLRREHGQTREELKEEKAKYEQLVGDYGKVAHRQLDSDSYSKLQDLHSALVMKMADMGEENEELAEQCAQARLDSDQAESKNRALVSESDAANNAYECLQTEHDTTTKKVTKLTHQLDLLKTKYYETLAGDVSIHTGSSTGVDERYESLRREYESILEKLRSFEAKAPATDKMNREHSEALAKIEILVQSNQELEDIKYQYHSAEAKATILEREVKESTKTAESATKREEKRATHLKDMLSHYKRLEKEHEEVHQKLRRLQAVVSDGDSKAPSPEDPLQLGMGDPAALATQAKTAAVHAKITAYERRIKELQQQRDGALEQMAQLEEELSRTRLEKFEANESRKAREQDLKVVLGHYHALQKVHEALGVKAEKIEAQAKADAKADATHHTVCTTVAVLVEGQEKDKATEVTATKDEAANELEETAEDADLVSEAENVLEEDAEENQDTDPFDVLDEDSIARLLVDMEALKRQQEARKNPTKETDMSTVSNVSEGISLEQSVAKSALSDEAPDTSWKDVKIAKLMGELEEAKNQVSVMEEKEEAANTKMSNAERKLLVAQREAEDAKKRQTAREGNLRDVIAQKKRMEKDHEANQETINELQEQLNKAKTEAKLREEETKAARKRAASYHTQFKKLQEKQAEAMKVIKDQEQQIEILSGQ